VILNKEADRLL